MTFEEYKDIAFKRLREYLASFPEDEVEEYIKSLEDDVKKSYEDSIELTEFFGTNQINPSSYAYGMMMCF